MCGFSHLVWRVRTEDLPVVLSSRTRLFHREQDRACGWKRCGSAPIGTARPQTVIGSGVTGPPATKVRCRKVHFWAAELSCGQWNSFPTPREVDHLLSSSPQIGLVSAVSWQSSMCTPRGAQVFPRGTFVGIYLPPVM